VLLEDSGLRARLSERRPVAVRARHRRLGFHPGDKSVVDADQGSVRAGAHGRSTESRPAMRVAAIDLGSNSVHMVVVEVSASGGFHVVAGEKEMVRLGAGTAAGGRLPAAAIRRGLEVLREYKRLAEAQGAEKILAVATSAVREASNGEDFLERVGREIGIWPRAISGEAEARLIYLAALHSVHLEGQSALVVDIGGGSVELALGAGGSLRWAVSEKLGALRMSARFVHSDPLSRKDGQRLAAHVGETIAPHVERIATEGGFARVIGTSGTILALGAMAHQMETREVAEVLHHVTVRADTLRELTARLVASDLRGRLKLPGIDPRRADIIVAGAVVLDTILGQLGVTELVLCEWALREGLLLDYIHGHPRALARAEAYPDVRRRSVVALAERCAYDEAHARHVARLALSLFDQTRHRHGLDDTARILLEYAALLHDVGHHISYAGHHKHAYYLIKNGDLRGFRPEEVELLANVARYHRRGHPRKKHAAFAALSRTSRRSLRVLAGCLRVADALDRSHSQVVRGLAVSERSGLLRIRAQADGDCELELWGAPRRTQLLEEALGIPVRVETVAIATLTTRALRSASR
jgi:exopolyphosphatase/guanosine-5'-triphosphate,3'-diphosphate pyrophosphatase